MAVIGDQLSDFQKPIVACLNRHLTRAGFGVVYMSGGSLKPTADWDEQVTPVRNALYPLSRKVPAAGFVILTASIGAHANARQLAQFVRQFSHKPVVCYGASVPRIASVQIDGYDMMSRLMEYLTADTRRKRFAFVRGFPDSPRSLSLERAFRDALTRHQLVVDEELFLNGNFHPADAYYAMDNLLQHRSDIDVVVSANDEMAQTVIHALAGHGLRVPEDVVVSGFHNSLAASTSLPPITTVQCTIDSMAAMVTASLKSQISSGNYLCGDNKVLHPPARLVIRTSTEPPAEAIDESMTKSAFDAVEFRTALLCSMSGLPTPAGMITEDVIDDIVSSLVNGKPTNSSRLETALNKLYFQPANIYWWRHLHRQITSNLELHGCEGQSPDALSCAAIILGKIHETVWSVENTSSLSRERNQDVVQRFRSTLMQVASMEDLIAALEAIGEHCRSQTAFLCLYEQAGSQPDEFARVVYQRPHGVLGEAGNSRYPSVNILPGEFLNTDFPGPLILEPLCVGNAHLGFIVLDMSSEEYRNQTNITELSDYIGNALWRVQNRH